MVQVRVLIADDHLIVREGLRWMLGDDSRIEIVGEADSAEVVLETIAATAPDVVLLDIHFPGKTGLEILSEIQGRPRSPAVVMLTMSDDAVYVEEAVRAGAAGYLLKSAPRAEVVRAVHAAASGDAYIQAEVMRPLLTRFAAEVRQRVDGPHLSPRELDVAALLADGLADKQIATTLGLSEPTVKGYLRQLYDKLGAADRAQAVAIAIRQGLIA